MGFDIENANPDYGARAARIDLADVHDPLVVGRPVNDPAAGGCERGDPGARSGLRFGLLPGRRSGNPDPAFTGLGQMAGRDAERRRGAGSAIHLGRSNVGIGRRVEDDGSRGTGAGTGNQQPGDCDGEYAAPHGLSSEMVGPNVVFGLMPDQIGLLETIRVRQGRMPWLGRHLARLRASLAALGEPEPPEDLPDLLRLAAGSADRVVRLELGGPGQVEISTREVNRDPAISVVVSQEIHRSYPHKTTARGQFERALAAARHVGAADAVLVTAAGYVAEGTAWNLFWWDDGMLCTPAAALGILPGVGRQRVLELADVRQQQVPPAAIAGKSLFLVNAVRGIVEIASFEGKAVPRDPRTAELAARFWPSPP